MLNFNKSAFYGLLVLTAFSPLYAPKNDQGIEEPAISLQEFQGLVEKGN